MTDALRSKHSTLLVHRPLSLWSKPRALTKGDVTEVEGRNVEMKSWSNDTAPGRTKTELGSDIGLVRENCKAFSCHHCSGGSKLVSEPWWVSNQPIALMLSTAHVDRRQPKQRGQQLRAADVA